MKKETRILEVLVEVVNNLLEGTSKDIEIIEKEIVEKLINKGYELNEINDLLDEIFEMMDLDYQEQANIRVLLPEEFLNFEDDAKEYLIYLKNSMIISEVEFEEALHELSSDYYLVNKDNLKSYLRAKGINPEITVN